MACEDIERFTGGTLRALWPEDLYRHRILQ
jgi:hypothetical protein